MFGWQEEFDYFECSSCGCLQIVDIPQPMDRYYPPEYFPARSQPAPHTPPVQLHSLWSSLHRSLTTIRNRSILFEPSPWGRLLALLFPAPDVVAWASLLRKAHVRNFHARMLDVGCGSGGHLSHLRQMGFDSLAGIDRYLPPECELDSPSLTIRRAGLEDAPGEYDLILFNHSLEHMENPIEALLGAARRLAPEGVCIVRLPTVSSDVWRTYGVDWVELDPPRHLFLPSVKSMEVATGKAGLQLFDFLYEGIGFCYWGSEQVRRGIPIRAPQSHWMNPDSSVFTRKELRHFEALAARTNRAQCGGRAAFFLRHASIGRTA